MEDLGTSVPSLPRIPLFPQLELLMKDYEFLAYQGYPPPPHETSQGALCRELVCGDYRCIPRGYGLV